MNNLISIIEAYAAAYPKMQPSDAVKLVYQATFGGGHMVSGHRDVISCLKSEYVSINHEDKPPVCESLGDTSRLYLDCTLSDDELELVAKIFSASARHFSKDFAESDKEQRDIFNARLQLLSELCAKGVFSFSTTELAVYREKYRSSGCPAVSHSQVYRDSYKPAYRVIDSRYVRLLPTVFEILRLIRDNRWVVLAIDGRAASGKTTAAALISELFSAQTIHMDHFFLPGELRTNERLSEVGGNIHRERFIQEILPSLRCDDGFSYRVFDCSRFDYNDSPRRILPAPLYIVEGSYAFHPMFGKYYDVSFFSDVSYEEQLERILRRNGERMLERFKNEWIPMEVRYFDSIGKGR